ncbi:MAG: DUF697 domain-containing protein [Oscillatoriophycideae cyanobacterium NC_groundwater_1537_Pr4_S-0.65um_50_18]|nr:DUF697 domain-containing protein [Oscillatoriophycideae cyanobacterium NC_groundwater_1537_Pr4_S-0.65um_50_18]
MSGSRLLALVVGILLILGLVIWLTGSLSQLYFGIAVNSPLLANILLVLMLALLLCAVAALFYFTLPFFRQRSERPQLPKIPEQKVEVARETLQAVQQQVAQIQDEIARQALIDRSREIEQSLSFRELHVVIFGTGSAGKTSIVNAVIGRMAGRVGATLGTTELGQVYRFQLKGLEREIQITDTPGILEVGVAGTDRENLARQMAADADLLLFVIDNDLRQSEYQALRALTDIGKRSLLVFNKTDLYPESDLDAVLNRIQQRVQTLMPPEDIVAIAAHPRSFRLENGELFQPEPEIIPLLRRMATVLRSEGEDLIADNILLQSQRLGAEARQLIDAERQRQAEKIVDRYQWVSAGVVSVTPLPFIDLIATAAINAQMVVELGRVYGCEINLERGKELAISLAKTLVSLGVVRGAIELLSIALQTNVGTFLIGRAIQGVTAAYLTRIAGRSFIEYFRRDQTWGDGGMTQVVQEQFQLNRRDEFVKAFVQDAIARIALPLKDEA